MPALLNLPSLITTIQLTICTCSYLKPLIPQLFNSRKKGFPGLLGKFAIIGERLSPYVSLSLIVTGFYTVILR
ncbi:hypothetical protein BmR1_04g07720 [Babesia microti strain RI]|uniref:Protein kish n=1 Tax=Babesia microti (strain RI) TaxID=1133968 RepID=I7IHF7_BABMR|nr:hypothetical protein BmR1_04g07720 [Babesia microti strain RI]CCF75732.1 hypothetical protein BmR1_04g07720 [Babesia microti strain RI]|eukprot:XP_012650140.1 hypothetical protein BmR1_04g07720 [Babesia microti strain RI]